MKKFLLPVCAVVLASSMMLTSCIGNFALTNKVLDWNHQISNKFVNELVFIGFHIIPVYEITALADLLVVNSIEFWSGNNPVASTGEKIVDNGTERYLVAWDESGYTITDENSNTVTRLNFNKDENSWSLATSEGDVTFLTFVDDSHVKVPAADGTYTVVELSQEGLLAYKDLVGQSDYLLAAK